MPETHEDPLTALRYGYAAESYDPGDYLVGAVPLLVHGGWLTRPICDEDLTVVRRVFHGLDDLGLDETDTYPLGLVWALRCTGAIGQVPDLDATLADWRRWEEDDHVGERLTFLPELPQ